MKYPADKRKLIGSYLSQYCLSGCYRLKLYFYSLGEKRPSAVSAFVYCTPDLFLQSLTIGTAIIDKKSGFL